MYLYEYLAQETLTFILCLQFLFFLQEGFGHGRVPHPQQMGVSTIFHLNIKSLLIGYQTNITFVCGGVMVMIIMVLLPGKEAKCRYFRNFYD